MNFTGKVVLITGAASGMGAASARQFAALGARVVVVDCDVDLAKKVASEIGADPPIIGDVSDSAFCRQVVESTMEKHGRLDVLVNCAGIIVRADAQSTTDEKWHKIMGVNVDGVFFMSREAVGPMKKQGSGAIINFGSIWGNVGAAGLNDAKARKPVSMPAGRNCGRKARRATSSIDISRSVPAMRKRPFSNSISLSAASSR